MFKDPASIRQRGERYSDRSDSVQDYERII